MSKIFHTCNAIGRQFTREEWFAYSDKHTDLYEPVMQHGPYKWNICDVCLNPDIALDISVTKNASLTVKVAQLPNGRWNYGYDIQLHNGGDGCGVLFLKDDNAGFPTKEECIFHCIEMAEKQTLREIEQLKKRGDTNYDYDEEGAKEPKASALVSCFKSFLEVLREKKEYYDPRQLRLF